MGSPYYIIDFDSTLVQCEALDELARISLAKNPKKSSIISEIERLTTLGMEGEITIGESLTKRVALLNASRKHLTQLIKVLKHKITPSFFNNREFLSKNAARIFIITGGFSEYVLPIVKLLGLRPKQVLANSFRFDAKGKIIGFDQRNPLALPNGKSKAVRKLALKGEIFVIGDGFTDYEIRKSGVATKFFAFTENISREKVVAKADVVVKNLDEFLHHNKLPSRYSFPKSKINVLLLENIHADAVAALSDEGFSVKSLPGALSEEQLCKQIKDVSILGIRSKTKVSKAVLAAAPRLMAVGAFCIGTEQVELAKAAEQGVIVFNAPFSNTRSVVELALGEIVMLLRRTFELSSQLHRGIWTKSSAGSNEVRGRKLGIVGYGNIGAQLSVLAESLGMQVYFYDVVEKLALGNAKKCKSLEELLALSEIVSVHVDGRVSNQNLFSKNEFEKMRAGTVFLNLSRGKIVDIAALVNALKSEQLAGAAIDVFPYEPSNNQEEFVSELRGLPNVILTPHVGGSTAEAQQAIGTYVAGKLIEYINTGSSFNSVNFPEIQLPALQSAHRFLHLHHNVPGILAKINGMLAHAKINILGQYLKTTDKIGYVITDVEQSYSDKLIRDLGQIPHTLKFRVLY